MFNMFKKPKQCIIYTFVNVSEPLNNNEFKPIFAPKEKQYTTKEFNNWHKYIRAEVNKLTYDRSNRKSKKQKEK